MCKLQNRCVLNNCYFNYIVKKSSHNYSKMARTKRNRNTSEGPSNFRSVAMQQLIDNEVGWASDDDSLPLSYVKHDNKQVTRNACNYIAG